MGAFWELPAKSRANPAKFGWKWAGLAMLFSLQLENGSYDFFHIFRIFFCMISLRTHKPEMPAHFCHLIFQLWVVCFHTCILFSGRHKYNLIPTTKKDKLMKNAKVKTDWKRMLLLNDPYTTVSGHFFDICMFIFHKPEVQTVILICSTGLNFNWFKSYGLKCSLRLRATQNWASF